jgi:hypothetical protein
MSDQNLYVIERLRRTDNDTILYRATINDPTVYTKPWTVEIPMHKRSEAICEYACHEATTGCLAFSLERALRKNRQQERGKLLCSNR